MKIEEHCLEAVLIELEEALATLVALHKQGVDLSAPVLSISRALEKLEDLLPEEERRENRGLKARKPLTASHRGPH